MMRIVRLTLAIALSLPASALAASAKVTLLEGTATRDSPGAASSLIAPGAELEDGDVVETSARGHAELSLGDGSLVRLDERSRVALDSVEKRPDGGWRVKLRLVHGQIWARVTRKTSVGAGFEIHTARAVAGVRGTELLVHAGDDHEVEVYQGVVEVELSAEGAGPAPLRVVAGKRLIIDRSGRSPRFDHALGDRPFATWVRARNAVADAAEKKPLKRKDVKEDRKLHRSDRRELR